MLPQKMYPFFVRRYSLKAVKYLKYLVVYKNDCNSIQWTSGFHRTSLVEHPWVRFIIRPKDNLFHFILHLALAC
jgi:hypothetical protein